MQATRNRFFLRLLMILLVVTLGATMVAGEYFKDTLPVWSASKGWKGPAPTKEEERRTAKELGVPVGPDPIYQRLGTGGERRRLRLREHYRWRPGYSARRTVLCVQSVAEHA